MDRYDGYLPKALLRQQKGMEIQKWTDGIQGRRQFNTESVIHVMSAEQLNSGNDSIFEW